MLPSFSAAAIPGYRRGGTGSDGCRRAGYRAGVARAIDVPYTTVRDWHRRFAARAEMLAVGFARAVVALGGLLPRLAGTAGAVACRASRAAYRGGPAALRASCRARGDVRHAQPAVTCSPPHLPDG